MKRISLALAAVGAAVTIGLAGAGSRTPYARPTPDRSTPEACRALADLRIEDTNLLSAALVPASDDLPEYCRVLGYVRPAINFEIRLPTSNWNGKFYMAGCGAFCGKLESENPSSQFVNSINYGLRRGYAVSTTDGGHWGEDIFDSRWAYHNRLAEIDFGYRAVHETARATKAVIKAFYGRATENSYFVGCSNGGRQAVMEALRYPDDFDGLISGAPVLDKTSTMMAFAWLARANAGPGGANLITLDEAKLVQEAVYEACDRLDGLEDGLISDPLACHFDPSTLACADAKSKDCLSLPQVKALKAIYQGPRDSVGRQLYPGTPLGSEPFWSAITGQTPDVNDDPLRRTAEGFLRYMAFEEDPGERFTIEDFDFDRDPARLDFMAQIYNADRPDLSEFRQHGGKLLMWHGWADVGVSPLKSIAYYEAVEARMGSREETQDFFRLFMVPGMDHCGLSEAPGIDQHGFDLLTALEQWVEQGKAPERLLTTKTDSTGAVLWTRPVCPYPQRAVYKGQGDTNDALIFECTSS